VGADQLVQTRNRSYRIRTGLNRWLSSAAVWLGVVFSPLVLQAADPPQTPLIVRGDRSFPPYTFINESDQPDGFNIDLIKAIAGLLKLDMDIGLDDWDTVQEALASGRVDLVAGMIRSAEGEKRFDFSIAHAGVFYCIFVRNNSPIKTIDDARGKEILVHAKAYSHEWLAKRHITDHLIPVPSPQEALQLLSEGRHDCAVVERLSGLTLLDSLKIQNVVMAGPPLLGVPYAFAVQKGNDRLLAIVNEGIHRARKNGMYDALYRKWFCVVDADAHRMALVRVGLIVLVFIISMLIVVSIWMLSLRRMVRQRTAELMKSEKRFQELSDLLPQTVFETDADGRLSFLNRSGFEMLGVNRTRPLAELHLSDFIPEAMHLDGWGGNADHRGKTCVVRGPVIDPFPALLYATPVMAGQHQVGWRGLLVDITFQKELEKQVIEAQKMEALGRLAGGVAHDFNNIVTGISAYAHLIRTQPQDVGAVVDSADKILMGCDRAGDLVHHFLVTAGRRQAEKQQVRLKTVVNEVFKLLQPTCGSHITLDNRVTGEVDSVWAEPALVFQILMNLCVNGVQAMAEDGGVLTLGLKNGMTSDDAQPQAQRVLFVSDQGPGIAPELLDRIFEPFFTTRRQYNGTGIGLFVVSQALSEMGGSITVESEPGKGATFIVRIPAMPPDPD
jgi:signal transduction histidine kinase/ABC-type amino acid transport substrate-binding protein